MIRMKADHHARTPSCLAVADRLRTRMPYSCGLANTALNVPIRLTLR
jgi:hypothetical protein